MRTRDPQREQSAERAVAMYASMSVAHLNEWNIVDKMTKITRRRPSGHHDRYRIPHPLTSECLTEAGGSADPKASPPVSFGEPDGQHRIELAKPVLDGEYVAAI